MQKIIDAIQAEPVLVVGLISAVLALVAAFGLHLSKEQTGAILAVVNAALALVLRGKVTPAGK